MKKTLARALALAAVGTLVMAGGALAATYTINDNQIFFPGWANGTGDDSQDQIGTPRVYSMTITVDDASKILESVSIEMTGRRVFDTLFINTSIAPGEAWDQWDYMIRDNTDGDATFSNYYKHWNSWMDQEGVYPVASTFDPNVGSYTSPGNGYTIVPDDTQAYGMNDARELHPNGIDASKLLPRISDDPHTTWIAGGPLVYDLTDLGITVSTPFSVAYVPWCANDVVGAPVPEPGTMLLLGTGLAGLVGVSRRKMRRS